MDDAAQLVKFYDEAYTSQSPAQAALYARWRALGAIGKAGHVLALCARANLRAGGHPINTLEIGCGDGALLCELHTRGFGGRLAGVEITQAAVDIARERAQIDSVELYDGSRLPAADGAYELGILSHVLEHVPDDRRAIAELRRVLRPTGVAIMQHPREETMVETYEDDSIIAKADRRKHFGQADHVRVYGRDFFDRLRAGGFNVETRRYADEVSRRDRERFALAPLGSADPGADIHMLS